MKLLFTKRAYARVGGSESLAYQFATRLASRGHDVRVVCAQAFDDRRVFTSEGVEVVQVKPRGGFLGSVADASTLVDLMRTDVLEWYAEDRELIHNIGREYLDSSLEVAEALGTPIVLTPLAHRGQFHGGDAPSDFARYRRADAITTMTDWEKGWFAGEGIEPDRIVTTGMGPNALRSRDGLAFRAAHGIPPDAPLVLYIGRKERSKGYIHLLDAAELVWRRHPDARFVFIGIPGFYSSFFDEFARYADERIVDIERATGAEKAAALDACDVFAMPSLHETFGIGYLEAWLHERPVVGGDIPPLREVIADGVDGLCVRQRVDDVARAIMRLLDDPALRVAMGQAGAAKLHERWAWDQVIARVEDAYARALANAHSDVDEALAGADVVHSIAREWATPLERAARATGAAFVETPLVHPGQRLSGHSTAELSRYRRDDGILALTNWEADWYRLRGVDHVHVTGIGPIISWLPEVPMDPATVLFVGRKERYKGYHALRDAAKIVWRSRPEVRFVAIGQDPWTARFLPRRRDERWVDRGVVTEEEKAEAYARATIFAMPSVHETFGHTYLEAWYAWRPVIAGDIPPLREVVRDRVDGLIVAQDPDAIARAVLALLGDPVRARRMGESGRFRLQEKWTWELVAERTERAYEAARKRLSEPPEDQTPEN